MPDFNNLFQECVPKMNRVTDDLHRMVDYNRDLQNMMIALLTINGILIFLVLKYRNGKQKQKRRRRSNRGKYRFNGIRCESSSIDNRYMNENSDAFMSNVHLFDDVLICGECRFQTNDINKFADHKSRECSNITKTPSEPESIQCCENTFKNSWKLLQHLTDKHYLNLYRDASAADDSQERRGPQPPSPLPSESVKYEQKSREMLCNKNSPILYDSTDAHEMSKDYCIGEIVDEEKQPYDKKPKGRAITNSIETNAILIKNDGHTCIPNLQLNIPMPTTPTSMPYYSDLTAATYGTQPLTTSVSVAAAGTPSVSSIINSEEDPNMLNARVFVGNLNASRVSREMLCNENSPILYDSTDAHEMSKDYCNGEIVDEEKQTYTYDKKPIFPTTTTSTTSGGFNGSNKNTSDITITVGDLKKASINKIGTTKLTNFNQHTTNFIVCFSDSLKPLNA